MKKETLARVTVWWPVEDETYFWADLLLGDVDEGPTTRIPDEGDVVGELVTWVKAQGHQSFLIEV